MENFKIYLSDYHKADKEKICTTKEEMTEFLKDTTYVVAGIGDCDDWNNMELSLGMESKDVLENLDVVIENVKAIEEALTGSDCVPTLTPFEITDFMMAMGMYLTDKDFRLFDYYDLLLWDNESDFIYDTPEFYRAFGEYLIEELGMLDEELNEKVLPYFDYEKYGRDISYECTISDNNKVFHC